MLNISVDVWLGHREDPATGLFGVGATWYDPQSGRTLTDQGGLNGYAVQPPKPVSPPVSTRMPQSAIDWGALGGDNPDGVTPGGAILTGLASALSFGRADLFFGEGASQAHSGSGYFYAGLGIGIAAQVGAGIATGGTSLCFAGSGTIAAVRAFQAYSIVGDAIGIYDSATALANGTFTPMDALGFAPIASFAAGRIANWGKWSCFAAGTPILTPDGFKPIEELKVGDFVLSRDENDVDGPVVPKLVEETFTRSSEILKLTVGGQVIVTTREHPLYVQGKGWTAAAAIEIGDRLATASVDWKTVQGKALTSDEMPVYNMCIADWHTYFVGSSQWGFSVWAHNTYEPLTQADQMRLGALGHDPQNFTNVLYRNSQTGDFVATLRGGQGKVALIGDSGIQPLGYARNQNGKYAGSYREITRADGSKVVVNFTEDGFADLLPHAVRDEYGNPIVKQIQMQGDYYYDFKNANLAAGFGDGVYSNPGNTRWHHSQDRTTMILVSADIHDALRHTGGVEMVQRFGVKSVNQVVESLFRPSVTVYSDVPTTIH